MAPRTGLSLAVSITFTDREDCINILWLSLSNWIGSMVRHNTLHRLYGGLPDDCVREVLKKFWELYRKIEPDLEIYEQFDRGEADPAATIPMCTHQDEGRGSLAYR